MSSLATKQLRLSSLLPDKLYIRLLYLRRMNAWPNLNHPKKYSEIIQWLKINGHLEDCSTYVDKFTVREYVSKTIGQKYLIPLIGVWDSFEEIPFDDLPKQFVLKATHGCAYNYICLDKTTIDLPRLKKMFDVWLNENYYDIERETEYKYCIPKIVCEKYIEDETGQLRDYKIYCSNGQPKFIRVDTDRFTDHKSVMFDTNWQKFDIQFGAYPTGLELPAKPEKLNEMLEVASKLSKKFPFVRVDLYQSKSRVYFGELTFTPGGGLIKVFPKKGGDLKLAQILKINLAAYK